MWRTKGRGEKKSKLLTLNYGREDITARYATQKISVFLISSFSLLLTLSFMCCPILTSLRFAHVSLFWLLSGYVNVVSGRLLHAKAQDTPFIPSAALAILFHRRVCRACFQLNDRIRLLPVQLRDWNVCALFLSSSLRFFVFSIWHNRWIAMSPTLCECRRRR